MGEAIALTSALCFAIANVTVMRGARPGSDDNGAFLSLLLTTGISALGWLLVGATRGHAPVTLDGLAWFAAAGVFAAFIGRVFLYGSVQRLGAMRASTVRRLSPFFSVLLGLGVLGEAFTARMAGGAVLIVASFAVLVSAQSRRGGAAAAAAAVPVHGLRAGYIFGVASAMGYALGNVLRKFGLAVVPDPLLGAFVGSLVGAVMFVLAAHVHAPYRRALVATFRSPNPWLYLAGTMSSAGQILQFAALQLSPMSKVALVSSMEVFLTIGLSMLFAGERLSPRVALAAVLGFAGTALLV
jgi:drug/metabolite transporter (DMT)-like permease